MGAGLALLSRAAVTDLCFNRDKGRTCGISLCLLDSLSNGIQVIAVLNHQQLEAKCLHALLDILGKCNIRASLNGDLIGIIEHEMCIRDRREAVQAFVESTQEYVTGEVKFKLYKGNIIKAGTTSPYSLYSESLASFTTGDLYDHHDADGFITLFGLPLKVRAMKMAEVKAENKGN